MLHQLIEDIRASNSPGTTSLWGYRIAGNILECHVPPSCHPHKLEYRLAVISVGQAVLAVSNKIEELGYHSLIQSFPSLERPDLIASVRYFERQTAETAVPDGGKNNQGGGFPWHTLDFLNDEAERFELTIQPAPRNVPVPSPKSPGTADNSTLYLLSSRFDNPFYWIKTGYWKENTTLIDQATGLVSKPLPIDFISYYTGRPGSADPLKNRYIQAGFTLPKSVRKPVPDIHRL